MFFHLVGKCYREVEVCVYKLSPFCYLIGGFNMGKAKKKRTREEEAKLPPNRRHQACGASECQENVPGKLKLLVHTSFNHACFTF